MWLIEQCKKEWDNNDEISYQDIVDAAKQAQPFRCFIYPDAPIFASPNSMIDAIRQFCTETGQYIPQTMGEIARCIYESLAFRYKQVLNDLQKLAAFPIDVLHIIGGGSQNDMLNAYTANAIGKKVIAGPSEATAIGNILVQAQTAGLVNNKQEMRNMVAQSFDLKTFLPEDIQNWESHYAEYLQATYNF
jgi:rhamnulokinase